MFFRTIVMTVALVVSVQVQAAGGKSAKFTQGDFSDWAIPQPGEQELAAAATEIKVSTKKRKLAQSQEFAEGDVKDDVKEFRKAFLAAKTPDQLEDLLVRAENDWKKDQWKSYSPDLKYFVANLLVIHSLRGIVWKLRPLFEKGNLLSGNKATHGAAVHMLRQMATGIDTFFPTEQWRAGFDYVTQPSKQMSKADQITTVRGFQKFVANSFVPALKDASDRTLSIVNGGAEPTLVWDRQMIYGTGKFEDNARRYVGYGPAEVYFSASLLQRGVHDAMVFAAYNQDDLLNIVGTIGKRFGIESALNTTDMGMTAEQRIQIIKASVRSTNFLSLQGYNPKTPGQSFGERAMSSAYDYLKMSVDNQKKAYDILAGDTHRGDSYVLNPIHYQAQTAPKLDKNVNQMVAAVKGQTTVHDIVSGDKIQLNLPAFYLKPYPSLAVLMANDWANKEDTAETTIPNAKGEKLTFRNYFYGRSISWDNSDSAWGKIVPSAVGKNHDYMLTAKRVINYSGGVPLLTGEIGLFVR